MQNLMGNAEGKRLLRRSDLKWEDNKIDLIAVGWESWTALILLWIATNGRLL
jgi:hypothetical protein